MPCGSKKGGKKYFPELETGEGKVKQPTVSQTRGFVFIEDVRNKKLNKTYNDLVSRETVIERFSKEAMEIAKKKLKFLKLLSRKNVIV